MPLDTKGGKANIKGGYNDIGRDGHFSSRRDSHSISGSNVQGSFNRDSDGNAFPFVANYAYSTYPVHMDIGQAPPWLAQDRDPRQRHHGQAQARVDTSDEESDNETPGNNSAWRGHATGYPPPGSSHNQTLLNTEDEDKILEKARRIRERRERRENTAAQAGHQPDPYYRPPSPPSGYRGMQRPSQYGQSHLPPANQDTPNQHIPYPSPPLTNSYGQPVQLHPPPFRPPHPDNVYRAMSSNTRDPRQRHHGQAQAPVVTSDGESDNETPGNNNAWRGHVTGHLPESSHNQTSLHTEDEDETLETARRTRESREHTAAQAGHQPDPYYRPPPSTSGYQGMERPTRYGQSHLPPAHQETPNQRTPYPSPPLTNRYGPPVQPHPPPFRPPYPDNVHPMPSNTRNPFVTVQPQQGPQQGPPQLPLWGRPLD